MVNVPPTRALEPVRRVGVETGGWISRTRKRVAPPPRGRGTPRADESLFNLRADQAHPVNGGDCEAATTTGLPEAGSVPQLNRAITRKAAILNPFSNQLSSGILSLAPSGLHNGRSEQ